jgi:hypothetical protein
MTHSDRIIAAAQAPEDVLAALQFLLLVEYLESEFYARGLAATGLIPASDRTIFTTIAAHETVHVTAVKALIQSRGATPAAKPGFDFTAKGILPGFNFLATQYETFRELAQTFEDLGVRAYKGQIPVLVNDTAALTVALTIHSVEARHACEVRRLRGLKGWITGSSRDDLPPFAQGVYDGEDNTLQGTVSVPTSGPNGFAVATQAFDEPLTMVQVMALVTAFLA